MPRPSHNQTLLDLPANLDPALLPRYSTRLQLSAIHAKYFGPLSPRTLENWPLAWRIVNGRAVADTRQFLAEAERRFNQAPVIRGGRTAHSHYQDA